MNTQETHTQLSTKYKPIPGNERIEIVKALVENQLTASQTSQVTTSLLQKQYIESISKREECGKKKKETKSQKGHKTLQFAWLMTCNIHSNFRDLKANFIAADQQESEIVQNQSDKMIQDDMGQMQALQFFKDNQQKLLLLLTDQESKNEVKNSFTTLNWNQFQDISKISPKTKKVQKWKKIKKFFKRQRQDRYQIKGKDLSSKYPQLTIEEKIKDTTQILQSQMNYMIQNYNAF